MSTAARGIFGGLAAGLALVACVGGAPSSAECERACSLASRCGLLPSALGGTVGEGSEANEADCVERCLASDTRDGAVAGLLDVLGSGDDDVAEMLPLCSGAGRNGCEEVIELLEETPRTSELEVITTLEVSMVSAISHASNFSPERWCCFGYLGELGDDEGDEGYVDPDEPGQGRSEVAAVYGVISSTFTCLDTIEDRLEAAAVTIDEPHPDPGAIEMECTGVSELWHPMEATMPRPGELPDLDADPCFYARRSHTLQRLDADASVRSCDAAAFRDLAMGIRQVRKDWHLDEGDEEDDLLLVGGVLRPLPDLQRNLEEVIRDEITRPGGFVSDVCKELDDEAGGDGCEGIDVAALDPVACLQGPPCSKADCLLESPGCDRTLCDADVSPPGRDCGFFGIETVTLGYRTEEGVEVLGEPIGGCTERSEVTTVFEHVKVGNVVPIAVVSGTLPTSFLPPDDLDADDGTFEWFVEGTERWVSAGDAKIQLPSPLLEHTINRYENPLELLGWVLPRVPRGRACDDQPLLCESVSNGNCDDGIDNDGDGFTDGASPWCDELFDALVDLCVVTEPGRPPVAGCRDEP